MFPMRISGVGSTISKKVPGSAKLESKLSRCQFLTLKSARVDSISSHFCAEAAYEWVVEYC